MKTRLRTWIAPAAFLFAIGGCGGNQTQSGTASAPAAAGARVLNLYQWADYFDPDVLKDFEKSTGIKVVYSTFDTQEVMESKMLTGRSGYDVVDVASYSIDRLAKAGVFRKLDRSQLQNWSNLDPDLMHSLELFDPGNVHGVGYLWGTTAIIYNADLLRATASDLPMDTWALVFDPRHASHAARCGISFNDSRLEIIGNALIAGGAGPNHPTAAQFAAAGARLHAIRPFVRRIDGPSQISELTSGSMCLMVAAGTNVAIARRRNKKANVRADLRYVIPKEGAVSWFDALAIPADAPHVAEAYEFLDFLLRPENAARNANYTGSATVNLAAVPMVVPSLRDDPMFYPDARLRATLKPLVSRDPAQARAETQLWAKFEFVSSP